MSNRAWVCVELTEEKRALNDLRLVRTCIELGDQVTLGYNYKHSV